jgi:hypothetical protein
LEGNAGHFTYFLKFPNNQGTCLAVAAIIHSHNSPGVPASATTSASAICAAPCDPL